MCILAIVSGCVLFAACAKLTRNHRSTDQFRHVPSNCYICYIPIELFPSTVMFGRIFATFVLVSTVAFFCAQSVEAVKGPKITHKVYFDIKHGDENLGRSKSLESLSN